MARKCRHSLPRPRSWERSCSHGQDKLFHGSFKLATFCTYFFFLYFSAETILL